METKAAIRSAMVSRLPKFGGRSSNRDTLPNGSTPPTPPSQDGKTTHPNGVIRAPSFSLKWKKDEVLAPISPTTDGASHDKPKTPLSSTTKEVKNASPGTPKMRRSGSLMVAVSSPKAIPKHAGKPSPKIDHKLSQNQLNGTKVSPIGSTQLAPEPNPVRAKLRSSSPRSSSQDSLSQSSDSFKTMAQDNMVRSNSFTHFKQIPSPTNQPMTRSFSFNRAVELAKPLANTQLRPPRTSLLKPPQMSNGRVGLGLGGLNGNLSGSGGLGTGLGGFHYSRTTASSLPTLSTPSAPTTPSSLKKPLLPNCVLNKSLNGNGGSVGYKLPRTAPVKQQPLLPGRVKEKLQPLAPEREGLLRIAIDSEAGNKAEKADFHSDSDGSIGERNVILKQSLGETLEEMSLSSASSLDRGDTSEEFLDDLDSTGDVLSDVDTAENTKSAHSRLQSLLNDVVDWPHLDPTEIKETTPMDESCGSLVLSPESSLVQPESSLELSPSNSSGGTYMWDEDGLEPLGGPASHPCDSYDDADLNSIDILNNLEPLGAGELEEDDLMLDVDLPEDSMHETDRLFHMEHSERGRPGQRRRHHRWSAPDHFHNNSRMHGFQHYDGFKAPRFSSRPFYSDGKQHGHSPLLDELTLEHMSQDCSSLKNHLLRLKNLLQLEDADSPAHAVVEEEAEDNSTAMQLQELIKEVQELREELKSRDRTIAQLTLQCQQLQQQQQEQMPAQGRQVRCNCHHQRAPSSLRPGDQRTDRRLQQHHDKTTQTYWRPPTHTPQILQPFNPCLKELRHQGRLTRAATTAGHSDRAPAHSEDCVVRPEHHTDVSCPADPEQLSHLLSAQLQWLDPRRGVTGGDCAASGAPREPPAPTVSPGSIALTCPRVLQPPRLHKRVSVPALKPGGAVRPPRSKQLLPPPSRGLPCFNTGPQVPAPSVCRTSVLQPYRDLQSTDCSPEQLNQSKLREPATAKIPIPTSRSCLPKPKIS